MQSMINRALTMGLALIAVHSSASAAGCDLSWMGSGITAAPTDSGHMIALRGTDGVIRLNEWRIKSKTWSGWMLPSNQNGVISDPWIQYSAEGGQNVYARSSTGATLQWICVRNPDGSWKINVTSNVPDGKLTPTGRVTSARFSTSGEQRLIATFADGTVKYQTWTLYAPPPASAGTWNGMWTDLGITNVVGSPWATQVTPTTVNLYVRLKDGTMRQNYWNGTSWSGWIKLPLPSAAASDPTSYFDGTGHWLDYMGTDGVPVQMMYYMGWTSSRLTTFPAKSSLVAYAPGSLTYGIDANKNVLKFAPSAPGQKSTSSQVNCLIP